MASAIQMHTYDYAVGQIIDQRYRLRRPIARGGMAEVFEAQHVKTGRAVAIKLVRLDIAGKAEIRLRLQRETVALGMIHHPYSVDVLDAGDCAESGTYLVMELLNGRTLDGILAARRQLPLGVAARIAIELAAVLHHAHERGIVHRDVKPGNVFVDRAPDGDVRVKLIDYGIARLVDDANAPTMMSTGDARLTRNGQVLGTPEYMAPEQLFAQPDVDRRADVYGLAATLFECLAGQVPVPGHYTDVLRAIEAQTVPDIRRLVPALDDAVGAVITRALSRDRDARYADTNLFAIALSEAVMNARSRPTAAAPETPVTPATVPNDAHAGPELVLDRAFHANGGAPSHVDAALPDAMAVVPAGAALRRRHVRAPYITPVHLLFENQRVVYGRTQDISEGGLFALVRDECPDDAMVQVRFAVPTDGSVVTVKARLRWAKNNRGASAVGLEFAESAGLVREQIALYVKHVGQQ